MRDSATLFRPGENCVEVARARRVGLLVDGEEYFTAFLEAAERATRSITILAWDFNSHLVLYPPEATGSGSRFHNHDPELTLGKFLNRLVRRRLNLHVRVLIWDYPMLFGLDREFPPIYGLGWRPHRRVHVRYDNTHPIGASHHQKIIVIDDAIAFCGGLDLTCRRWDTRYHRAQEPRRTIKGIPYPPFHDIMMAVDGDAALSLANLARERWRLATGEILRPVKCLSTPARHLQTDPALRRTARHRLRKMLQTPGNRLRDEWGRHRERRLARALRADRWPPSTPTRLTDIDVAISRTVPAMGSQPLVREVEQLYLDMVAAAKRSIYIENQYFTVHRVGELLEARLKEADPPEIILILRRLSHGWLEALSMEALRTRLIRKLQAADHKNRFHFYYPHVEGLAQEHCIDVHSKVMIVDDEILRIGSANLANRSMGFDTECDLTVEARGNEEVAERIAAFRTQLLAEHLGVTPEFIAETQAQSGSLRATIESLRQRPEALQKEQRTLVPLTELPEISDATATLMKLADPEQPVPLDSLTKEFAPTEEPRHGGPAWGRLAAIAVLLAAFAAAWQWTPLASFATGDNVALWAQQFADAPWAPFATVLAYTPASIIMFPRPLITLFGVIAFGPALGFAYSMSGNLLTAFLSFVVGRRLNRDTVRKLAGPNLNRISAVLRQRGVVAITALRLVPLAPFAVPGIVAGAAHVKLSHFMAGSFFGLLPGTLTTTVFGGAIQAALHDTGKINYWLVGGVATVLIVGTWWVRRWLLTTRLKEDRR